MMGDIMRQSEDTPVELGQRHPCELIACSDPALFDTNLVIRRDAKNVAIVGGVMKATKRKAVANLRHAFCGGVRNDMGTLQQRARLEFAY